MKSVLVVGAGPAGLVAAKTLLQHAGGTAFKVTIFEAAERVGGMWRAQKREKGIKCNPLMRTNLSRFTVAFPDLSWASVDLTDPNTENGTPEPLSMFPHAWQVGRYLETYAKKFIPFDALHLNRAVEHVNYRMDTNLWCVLSHDKASGRNHEDLFDYVIMGTGFFGQPHKNVPEYESIISDDDDDNEIIKHSTGESLSDDIHKMQGNMLHSSEFRDVASLVDGDGDIAIIGGGISGSEAAATAAFQISSARHMPGKQKPSYSDKKVYHIFNRPTYCLPRYLPQDPYNSAIQDCNLAPTFVPLDLALYNLSRRGNDPIVATNGPVAPSKAELTHKFLRNILGGDQRELGQAALVYNPAQTQYPPYTAISDTYAEFVRSGLIVPVQGRAVNIKRHLKTGMHIEVGGQEPWSSTEEPNRHLVGISGVIQATGFRPDNYFSGAATAHLNHDKANFRVPYLLSRGSLFCADLPTLAFIGYYEGPFWGVMEAQAQLVARTWAPLTDDDSQLSSLNDLNGLDSSEAVAVRQALKSAQDCLSVPQFWMSDYVGLIEELSRAAGIRRDDHFFDGQNGPAFPARYHGDSNDEALQTIEEVSKVIKQSTTGARFVAAAAFRSMQGKWTLQRKIDSRHSSMPGGTLKGTAHFHPRDSTDPQYTAEYLYIEDGKLTMDNGLTFPATRRYVYRYSEAKDQITAWFTDEDGESTGGFFNAWEFHPPDDVYHGWLAKGHHWCSPDTYKSNCEFRFRGVGLESFGITYDVSGPNKDYTHESWYRRPAE
ncbi:hypothetical protein BS50DRAFT_60966 [Corynespora cassiicola Philippines]|uniref:DUF6314 domain-containing protein n=1 Tax=Corynespora cassiicola Philippines TaxID=1448308 RepID=A0A2T2NJC5_CORCC|nr:hypothetical protein BS50DRAFT_60966 [Corynespora cassiicola Philippines]